MKKKSKKRLIITIAVIAAVFVIAGVVLSKMLYAGKADTAMEDKTIAKVEKGNMPKYSEEEYCFQTTSML